MSARCCRCNYYAMDLCARCGEPYCENCMAAGCCGTSPALSGVEEEFQDQLDAVRSAAYSDMGFPQSELVSPEYPFDEEELIELDERLETERSRE